MNNLIKSLFIVLLFSFSNISCSTTQPNNADSKTKKDGIISADDSRIKIHGAKFVKVVDGELIMHRHTDEVYAGTTAQLRFNPEKAKSGSGITMTFKTSSPTIKLNFRIDDREYKKKPRTATFGIFQSVNELKQIKHTNPAELIKPDQTFVQKYEKGKKFSIDIKSKNVGKLVEYKITMPTYMDVYFRGLELENGFDLVDFKENAKPTYVAYGNSITHGTGQKATYETYPYLLSQWMNWDLYNVAVGGGKTSPEMAKMISNNFDKIDVMTILIGYNDYAGGGESHETYREHYNTFLDIIRSKHPDTKLYCITFTTTKMAKSKKSDEVPENFRKVLKSIVKERQAKGDKNIILIEGDKLSTLEDLNDNVHFTVDGALHFADKLYGVIND